MSAADRSLIIDVSRLVLRRLQDRLPTGIDRVCLAYLAEFAPRSRAMLQWGERRIILRDQESRGLFEFLLGSTRGGVRRLHALLARSAVASYGRYPDLRGSIYLNVGHTGLNSPGLATWLRQRKLRPVYLIHDLIPVTHPYYCRPGEPAKHAARVRTALATAEGIIVNSAATRDELGGFAAAQGLAMPSTLVAHLGVEALPAGSRPAHPRPYFLSIGTIEARKNHVLLLRVWEALREALGPQAPDLLLVGQRGWEADTAFTLLDHGPHRFGEVIELGRCDDDQLAGLIDHARALLMPSHIEGYGLPVLEAMARGTPVVASDLAVFRELGGGIPLLLDSHDERAWRRAVTDYLADGPARSEQIAKLKTFTAPSWDSHFQTIRNWLNSL